jgi:transposase
MEKEEVMVMSPGKKGEEMEGARRATGISLPEASHKYQNVPIVPGTEVTEKAARRRFTAEYKRHILRKADALREQKQVGALLRREGLYYSNLTTWRRQAERGTLDALSKNRGPGAKKHDKSARLIKEKDREILKLKAELKKAELIIDAQKKITEIFQISLDQRQEES